MNHVIDYQLDHHDKLKPIKAKIKENQPGLDLLRKYRKIQEAMLDHDLSIGTNSKYDSYMTHKQL